MVRLVYHERFLKSVALLPVSQQRKLALLLELVQDNPYHARLHTKQLAGQLAGLLSFRITRDWRVIFQFLDPATIQLLRVRHRKDVYR